MSTRVTFWLAWSLAGISAVMFLASLALQVLFRSAQPSDSLVIADTLGGLLLFLPFLAFPMVGALISSRRPRNPVGWICLAAGSLWMLIFLSDAYSAYGIARPGSVPFPVTIKALLYAWLWVPTVGLIGTYLLLLFPDGKLPSQRWRPLAWLSGAVILVEGLATFFMPGPLDGAGGARNPFGLEGAPWVGDLAWIALPLLPLCMVASVLSLVMRYRRYGTEVRQQIKWMAFAASLMGLTYLLILGAGTLVWLVSARQAPADLGSRSWWGPLLENVMVLSFTGVPIAIGFAVLKYRLYDIDVIINRTLVYGSLTVSLATFYFGGVALLQYVLRALSGGESSIAIVASTLAIAALFGPLRRIIQNLIDRRFYRNKYDAAKTLAAFNATLRNETDLQALCGDLIRVVGEAVQPAHVSLWIRPETVSIGHRPDRSSHPGGTSPGSESARSSGRLRPKTEAAIRRRGA